MTPDPDQGPDSERVLELEPTAIVAGGDALARDANGRVVFVQGALPGERVRVEVTQRKRDYLRAVTTDVLEAAPDRVEPPCPWVAAGCGGCDFQWMTPAQQRRAKVAIVTDALRRLGRVDEPDVREGPVLTTEGYRTSVRAVVLDGRAGYRRRHSHDGIAVDHCLVAHPLVDELLEHGRFGEAREVTLRVGAHTGERLALVAPRLDDGVRLPDDVIVVADDELRSGRRAWFHEEVAGRVWRISARAFFQVRPDGAEALIDQIRSDAAGLGTDLSVVDMGAGVGLFAGTVGVELAGDGGRVVAVERSSSAMADARINLADLPVSLFKGHVEEWKPTRADVVIADPSRDGLRSDAVDALTETGADRLILVSCDAGALGRDTRLLAARGYRHVHATLIDLFPHTSHVEVVSRFDRDVPSP